MDPAAAFTLYVWLTVAQSAIAFSLVVVYPIVLIVRARQRSSQ